MEDVRRHSSARPGLPAQGLLHRFAALRGAEGGLGGTEEESNPSAFWVPRHTPQ